MREISNHLPLPYLSMEFEGKTFGCVLRRKITLVAGNTGTGKTATWAYFVNAIQHEDVEARSSHEVFVATTMEQLRSLMKQPDPAILVGDDIPTFTEDDEEAIRKSHHFFILSSRAVAPRFSVPADSFVTLCQEGNRLWFQKYPKVWGDEALPDLVLIEDEVSGFYCLSKVFASKWCLTARGRDKIFDLVEHMSRICKHIAVICDNSAAGRVLAEFEAWTTRPDNMSVRVYTPESFEFLLALVYQTHDSRYLDAYHNSGYCEHVYEKLLIEDTKGTPYKYAKDTIPYCAMSDCCNVKYNKNCHQTARTYAEKIAALLNNEYSDGLYQLYLQTREAK